MTYIRIRYKKEGGHYHCRLFTSQNYNGTYAKCGDLVFDEREWGEVRDKLSRCEWLPEDVLPDELPEGATFNFEPGDGSIVVNPPEKKA